MQTPPTVSQSGNRAAVELRPGAEGTQMCSTRLAGKEGKVLPGVEASPISWWDGSHILHETVQGSLSERLAHPQREAGVWTEANQTHCPRPLPFRTCPKPDKVVTVHSCSASLTPSRRPPPDPQQPGSLPLCPCPGSGLLEASTRLGWWGEGGEPDPSMKTSVIITAHFGGIFTCSPGSVLSPWLR